MAHLLTQAGKVPTRPDNPSPNDSLLRAVLANTKRRQDLVRGVRLSGAKHLGSNVFAPIIDILV
jgi:hypothetical protein